MELISFIEWMLLSFVVVIIFLFLALLGYTGYILFWYHCLSNKDQDAYESLGYLMLPFIAMYYCPALERCMDVVCCCWLCRKNQPHSSQETTLLCLP